VLSKQLEKINMRERIREYFRKAKRPEIIFFNMLMHLVIIIILIFSL